MGDVAMLQVAVRRLNGLWPSAEIHVFTEDPHALAIHCPGVHALSHEGRRLWFTDHALLGGLERHAPRGVRKAKTHVADWLRRRSPALLTGLQRSKARLLHHGDDRRQNFLDQLGVADLHVVSGNALLNDKNRSGAALVLQTMEVTARRGAPVVMVSQGVGPLRDEPLIEKARSVLPLVQLIGLREGLSGAALLTSLGVSAERLIVTGDDAVEMARAVPSAGSRPGIGVNMRVAKSTDVPGDLTGPVRSVLQKAARELQAPLIPVPIAFHSAADDPKWIRQLLSGFENGSDGGRLLATPRDVIEQAGRCRIVVTAAYHAGVFALAQGAPVIALVYNEYYELKFRGLADMFPGGCELIHLQSPTLPGNLLGAIQRAWAAADSLRPSLLKAADLQVELSASAYRRIRRLVEEKHRSAEAARA